MALISRLGVVLGLDSGEFTKGMGLANTSLLKFATVGNAAKAAVVDLGKDLLAFADQVGDVAKANEISIASVVKLSGALQQSGGRAEDVGRLYSSLTNKMDDALQGNEKTAKSFKDIGISIEDLKHLNPEQLFEKTLASLAKMEDPIRRNALAAELLGKSMRGVDAKGLAGEMDKMSELARNAEPELEAMNDVWDRIGASWYKAKLAASDALGPAIVAIGNLIVWLGDTITKTLELMDRFFQKMDEAAQRGAQKFKYANRIHDPTYMKGEAFDPTAYSNYTGALGPDFSAKKVAGRETYDPAMQKKIESQTEALLKQLRVYKLETDEVGKFKSEYSKLLLEFEKGGKYDQVKDKALRDRIINQAKELDQKKKMYDLDKDKTILINARERLSLESSLADATRIQRDSALARFDLEQKVIAMRKEGKYNEREIQELKELEELKIRQTELDYEHQRTFEFGWKKAYNSYVEDATNGAKQAEQVFTSLASNMESALDKFVKTGKLSFSDLARSIIADLIKIQMRAQMTSIFGKLGSLLGFGGSSGSGLFTGSTGESYGSIMIGARAGGGDIAGGSPYLVGENGPELVVPKGNGTVIPNNQLGSMMGGPQIVYNGPYIQNMSAIDTQSATQFLSKNKQAVWSANQSANRSLPQSR
jgi:lambda family phage tail tape measure protein